MKLYYAPGTCALATHITLAWIGEPYELQQVGLHPKSPELLEVNPAGAVPVIEHDGRILTQNAAILDYLAQKYPDAKLDGGGTPEDRAEVNHWVGLLNSDVHPGFKPLFGATGYLEDEAAIEKTKEHARRTVRGKLELVDQQLQKHDNWITGTRSIADPYLFVISRWARAMDIDLDGLDAFGRFHEHMLADAGVAKALREEGLD